MSESVFLFDLDSTITGEEILPTIANEIGKGDEMRFLTESTMMGEIPFEDSFRARVKMLDGMSYSVVSERVARVRLNSEIVNFLKSNKNSCYIVTSNLDVWIEKLIEKIDMRDHVFCSEAKVKDGRVCGIKKILRKEESLKYFVGKTIVAVGDGSNDYKLLRDASIGIGFGGVRRVASKLMDVCDYAVYDERTLCKILLEIKG